MECATPVIPYSPHDAHKLKFILHYESEEKSNHTINKEMVQSIVRFMGFWGMIETTLSQPYRKHPSISFNDEMLSAKVATFSGL